LEHGLPLKKLNWQAGQADPWYTIYALPLFLGTILLLLIGALLTTDNVRTLILIPFAIATGWLVIGIITAIQQQEFQGSGAAITLALLLGTASVPVILGVGWLSLCGVVIGSIISGALMLRKTMGH
jgi:hypothetical protein